MKNMKIVRYFTSSSRVSSLNTSSYRSLPLHKSNRRKPTNYELYTPLPSTKKNIKFIKTPLHHSSVSQLTEIISFGLKNKIGNINFWKRVTSSFYEFLPLLTNKEIVNILYIFHKIQFIPTFHIIAFTKQFIHSTHHKQLKDVVVVLQTANLIDEEGNALIEELLNSIKFQFNELDTNQICIVGNVLKCRAFLNCSDLFSIFSSAVTDKIHIFSNEELCRILSAITSVSMKPNVMTITAIAQQFKHRLPSLHPEYALLCGDAVSKLPIHDAELIIRLKRYFHSNTSEYEAPKLVSILTLLKRFECRSPEVSAYYEADAELYALLVDRILRMDEDLDATHIIETYVTVNTLGWYDKRLDDYIEEKLIHKLLKLSMETRIEELQRLSSIDCIEVVYPLMSKIFDSLESKGVLYSMDVLCVNVLTNAQLLHCLQIGLDVGHTGGVHLVLKLLKQRFSPYVIEDLMTTIPIELENRLEVLHKYVKHNNRRMYGLLEGGAMSKLMGRWSLQEGVRRLDEIEKGRSKKKRGDVLNEELSGPHLLLLHRIFTEKFKDADAVHQFFIPENSVDSLSDEVYTMNSMMHKEAQRKTMAEEGVEVYNSIHNLLDVTPANLIIKTICAFPYDKGVRLWLDTLMQKLNEASLQWLPLLLMQLALWRQQLMEMSEATGSSSEDAMDVSNTKINTISLKYINDYFNRVLLLLFYSPPLQSFEGDLLSFNFSNHNLKSSPLLTLSSSAITAIIRSILQCRASIFMYSNHLLHLTNILMNRPIVVQQQLPVLDTQHTSSSVEMHVTAKQLLLCMYAYYVLKQMPPQLLISRMATMLHKLQMKDMLLLLKWMVELGVQMMEPEFHEIARVVNSKEDELKSWIQLQYVQTLFSKLSKNVISLSDSS